MHLDDDGRARIIPARAGFTCSTTYPTTSQWDHPRSRGVYPTTSGQSGGDAGSSPLARGLPRTSTSTNAGRRIIPARAGFTRTGSARHAPPRDHPRSRGVYFSSCATSGTWNGSSPLARGLQRLRSMEARGRRIIPARAGFTRPGRKYSWWRQDHPRSRGVYPVDAFTTMAEAGSSPLARGLHSQRLAALDRTRIIPARAGFTVHDRVPFCLGADHPRSRGVYADVFRNRDSDTGSSPLARGLHLRQCSL